MPNVKVSGAIEESPKNKTLLSRIESLEKRLQEIDEYAINTANELRSLRSATIGDN